MPRPLWVHAIKWIPMNRDKIPLSGRRVKKKRWLRRFLCASCFGGQLFWRRVVWSRCTPRVMCIKSMSKCQSNEARGSITRTKSHNKPVRFLMGCSGWALQWAWYRCELKTLDLDITNLAVRLSLSNFPVLLKHVKTMHPARLFQFHFSKWRVHNSKVARHAFTNECWVQRRK